VSRSERSGEGGNHPFRLDENSLSVAYLTNITQRPTKVMVAIFHSGGMFTPELMAVGPGETIAIDILKLRDSQAKDMQISSPQYSQIPEEKRKDFEKLLRQRFGKV